MPTRDAILVVGCDQPAPSITLPRTRLLNAWCGAMICKKARAQVEMIEVWVVVAVVMEACVYEWWCPSTKRREK